MCCSFEGTTDTPTEVYTLRTQRQIKVDTLTKREVDLARHDSLAVVSARRDTG